MAFDAFLKIDGIDGESSDKTHKGEIEIDSFSWGNANAGSIGSGGGGGAGKVSFQDFHFSMPISKASPLLMKACATGQHFPTATLTCRKAGGSQVEFLKIKLADILVSSFQNGGLGQGSDIKQDELPLDQLSLNFVKIDFLYTVDKTGETTQAAFDLRENKTD
jgi:type VI secretion system secreted protein Hcp